MLTLFKYKLYKHLQTRVTMHSTCGLLMCVLVFLHTSVSFSQNRLINDNWYRGTVILAEGDSLSGDLQYDLQNDLLQINNGGSIKAYSARQLWSFSFYDPDRMADRRFFAIPYSVESNYKVPILFEIFTEGEVSLLAREKLVTENIPQYGYGGYGGLGRYGPYAYRTRIAHDYFFGFADGRIKRFDGSKKDLLFLLKDKSGEMKKLLNRNRFRYDDPRDLVQIINYYNSLKN